GSIEEYGRMKDMDKKKNLRTKKRERERERERERAISVPSGLKSSKKFIFFYIITGMGKLSMRLLRGGVFFLTCNDLDRK
ncbi:MAG: hypothetical protein FWH19_05270, partial [Treponema sp.]|nr:hypothetical protein [Treponema sp.]